MRLRSPAPALFPAFFPFPSPLTPLPPPPSPQPSPPRDSQSSAVLRPCPAQYPGGLHLGGVLLARFRPPDFVSLLQSTLNLALSFALCTSFPFRLHQPLATLSNRDIYGADSLVFYPFISPPSLPLHGVRHITLFDFVIF